MEERRIQEDEQWLKRQSSHYLLYRALTYMKELARRVESQKKSRKPIAKKQ